MGTHHPAETWSTVKGSATKGRLGVMRLVPLHQEIASNVQEEEFAEDLTVEEEVEDMEEVLDAEEETAEEEVVAEALAAEEDTVEVEVDRFVEVETVEAHSTP